MIGKQNPEKFSFMSCSSSVKADSQLISDSDQGNIDNVQMSSIIVEEGDLKK